MNTLCSVSLSETMNVLEVKFIGDEDALEHIVDKQEGMDDSLCMSANKVLSGV